MISRNVAVAVAMALAGSQALAADVSAPLAPGKPAGVHEAQRSPNLLLMAGVSALVVAGVVIAVTNSDDATPPTAPPTTTTTGTSG